MFDCWRSLLDPVAAVYHIMKTHDADAGPTYHSQPLMCQHGQNARMWHVILHCHCKMYSVVCRGGLLAMFDPIGRRGNVVSLVAKGAHIYVYIYICIYIYIYIIVCCAKSGIQLHWQSFMYVCFLLYCSYCFMAGAQNTCRVFIKALLLLQYIVQFILHLLLRGRSTADVRI